MIEWKIGDDGWNDVADKQGSPAIEVPESSKTDRSTWRRCILIGMSLMLVLVAATGIALKRAANRNAVTAKAAVQNTVDQEMWALESGNWDLYESLLDRQTPAGWYREQQANFVHASQRGTFSAEITDFALVQPDLALAEVKISLPDGQARRETRAYRQASALKDSQARRVVGGNTWYRTTAPAGNLWVRQVIRETANLRFVYHRDDAEWLEPLFPALQELYTQLLTDFSLTPLPNRRELQVVLSVQPADPTFVDTSRRYDLSPLTAADSQSIRRELGIQLTDRVTRQFYKSAGNMAFVLDGIRQWEIAKWMGEPDLETQVRITQVLNSKPFVPLLMLQPANFDKPTLDALVTTVIDYLVWHKERDILKALIQGIRQHDGWTSLIESGLGMSYREVADGWWRFIARRYIPSRTSSPDEVLANLRQMLQLEQRALNTHHLRFTKHFLSPLAA